MRRAVLLAVLLAFAAGCPNQSASTQAVTARQLDQALAKLREAGSGFVPADQAREKATTIADYRQDTLQESIEVLNLAIESGTPGQRVAARRMLADVNASSARHHARRGGSEAAALSNRAATLYGYLIAVDRAEGRAASMNTDYSAVLAKLESELTQAQRDRAAAQEKVKGLQPQIDSLLGKIAGLKDKSASLRSQAEGIRRESFNITGDARYDRLDEADKVQLAGDNADFEAQRLVVDLENLQSQKRDHQRSLEAAEQEVKLISDVRQQTTDLQAQTATLRQQADADRSKATDDLAAEFKLIAETYDSKVVAGTFEKALDDQRVAVAELEKAINEASGVDRSVIEADLVGKLLDKMYVVTEYASVAGEFGRSIDSLLVRAETLMPNHVATIKAVRRQVYDRQTRLVEEANQTATRARELISQMRGSAPDGGATATALARQQQALDRYGKQLQQATLEQRA